VIIGVAIAGLCAIAATVALAAFVRWRIAQASTYAPSGPQSEMTATNLGEVFNAYTLVNPVTLALETVGDCWVHAGDETV
jgi:hypothetical protein